MLYVAKIGGVNWQILVNLAKILANLANGSHITKINPTLFIAPVIIVVEILSS